MAKASQYPVSAEEISLTTDICFVPDSQVIFPSVFLKNAGKIRYPSCMYKDCFDVLKQSYTYILLPANKRDFSNLILEKFKKLLQNVETEIIKARQKKNQRKKSSVIGQEDDCRVSTYSVDT
ncbi:hypothetical protein HXY33_00780 [Candidatus Bathyarchaeota archaeon]|nr:hypothetical protein [Candidatus Bathyarchaeota archaeon]